jgi:FAD:protein FMN transferase
VEVSIYGEEEARAKLAVASVMEEFQRLHDLLHAWKPSKLSELNAAFANGKAAFVTPEIEAMLLDATQLSEQSGGLFNPAIGGLVKLWGFQADEFKPALPDANQLAALVKAQPRMREISLLSHRASTSASTRNRALQLDLGGYAKGYALDRAVLLLKQQGVHNALINIGGNVLALGTHGSRAWRVGIQHPRKPGPLATLDLHDGEAIGTSGDYQRYFELDGKRYCHLIDPRNGQPAQGVQAVTVLTHGPRAGVLSDATSKPLFIAAAGFTADRDAWLKAAQQMQLSEALLVDTTGTVHLTAGMQKRLEFTDKNIAVKLAQ